MSDGNIIFVDLPKPQDFLEASVLADSSGYASEKRGVNTKIERNTVPFRVNQSAVHLKRSPTIQTLVDAAGQRLVNRAKDLVSKTQT